MEQILTAEGMRRYETHAIKELGIPDLVLMERAALAVADEIEKEAIEASNGKIIVEKSEKDIYFKEENRLFKIL